MQLLDNVIIPLLIVGAFIAGKVMADRYNERTVAELQYQLRLNAAQHGVGYVAPPPVRKQKRVPIGQDFMDKLKSQGRATQQISSPNS